MNTRPFSSNRASICPTNVSNSAAKMVSNPLQSYRIYSTYPHCSPQKNYPHYSPRFVHRVINRSTALYSARCAPYQLHPHRVGRYFRLLRLLCRLGTLSVRHNLVVLSWHIHYGLRHRAARNRVVSDTPFRMNGEYRSLFHLHTRYGIGFPVAEDKYLSVTQYLLQGGICRKYYGQTGRTE